MIFEGSYFFHLFSNISMFLSGLVSIVGLQGVDWTLVCMMARKWNSFFAEVDQCVHGQ